MTMPDERTRAVQLTRRFLDLVCSYRDDCAFDLRLHQTARGLLRHYPTDSDLEFAARACPMWWGMPSPTALVVNSTAVGVGSVDEDSVNTQPWRAKTPTKAELLAFLTRIDELVNEHAWTALALLFQHRTDET